MTNADTAPEEAHNEGIEDGRTDGDCFVHLRACLSSFMHDCVTERPFLDGEPVLFCTKLIEPISLAASRTGYG